MRACGVETYVNILKAMVEEIIYTEIYSKISRPRLTLERRHIFCASLRNRNIANIS